MLTISRPEIQGDFIEEFDQQQRFIKLPIKKYLQLLDCYDTLNRPQTALINAVNNPHYRFVCAAYARRIGKTYISNIIAQLVLLIPNTNVLIISPNYNLSSISFDLQRKFIQHFDLEVLRDNLKDKVIELCNGSTIRMGSLSTVDSVVGRSYKLILFDEAALGVDGEQAFNVQLRPTLDSSESKAIFISTPRGQNNWFSKFYKRGFLSEYSQWCSLHSDYTENTRVSVEDIQEAKKVLSNQEFEQEYLASFNTFEGQIYKFSKTCIGSYQGVLGETIAGCDPGFRDETAFVVVRYSEGCFYVLAEYLEKEKPTSYHAEQFKQLVDKYQVEITYIDSAAAQFAADLTYEYDLSTSKADKSVLSGIAYVQNLIENDRLFVDESCKHVLAMLDQYRWDNNSGLQREKPVHDEYSHIADALRYCLYTFKV